MNAEWAAVAISVVVILSTACANAIGAAITNRRQAELKQWISDRLANVGERLARVETKLGIDEK